MHKANPTTHDYVPRFDDDFLNRVDPVTGPANSRRNEPMYHIVPFPWATVIILSILLLTNFFIISGLLLMPMTTYAIYSASTLISAFLLPHIYDKAKDRQREQPHLNIWAAVGSVLSQVVVALAIELGTRALEGDYNEQIKSGARWVRDAYYGKPSGPEAAPAAEKCDAPTRNSLIMKGAEANDAIVTGRTKKLRERTNLTFTTMYSPSYIWGLLTNAGATIASLKGSQFMQVVQRAGNSAAHQGYFRMFRFLGRALGADLACIDKSATINPNIYFHMYLGFMSNFDHFLVSPYGVEPLIGSARVMGKVFKSGPRPLDDDYTSETHSRIAGEYSRLLLLAEPTSAAAYVPAHFNIAAALFIAGVRARHFNNTDAIRRLTALDASFASELKSINSDAYAYWNLLNSASGGATDLVEIPEYNGNYASPGLGDLLADQVAYYTFTA